MSSLAIGIEPVRADPALVNSPADAYLALADAAAFYLSRLHAAVTAREIPSESALVTRVRGTGPGVSFASLLEIIREIPLEWECPFEGSHNVQGAAVRGCDVLGPTRTDGFLFLRFAPGTQDLPLHLHPSSDRFIFAIGGRGFFHLTMDSINTVNPSHAKHLPVRDRDALMFGRGVVHTFSTAEHELLLLSYHQPYIDLDDSGQYTVTDPPVTAQEFLKGNRSKISFDSAWTLIAGEDF